DRLSQEQRLERFTDQGHLGSIDRITKRTIMPITVRIAVRRWFSRESGRLGAHPRTMGLGDH
ncbi:hypothetical protein, partial [Nocardia sp. NPDC051981]|uniref:hypothetical protein n=1 Tax=Nocardia sp. NPDC051981 TaxID=3155417 RepID=UPI0034144523